MRKKYLDKKEQSITATLDTKKDVYSVADFIVDEEK